MRILFVCLGNICRSPLAEGIMLNMNSRYGLGWTIDSAGTAGYHIGESPDHRTVKNACKHGVDLKSLRARQFTSEDFDLFDKILVMDINNYKNVQAMAQNQTQIEKVHLFLEYTSAANLNEVPDPYYGTEGDFEDVFQLVWNACDVLIKKHSSK